MPTKEHTAAFPLNVGIDSYNPEVTSSELKLQTCNNAQPFRNRLVPPFNWTDVQTLGSATYLGFAYYTDPTVLKSQVYALADDSFAYYDEGTSAFVACSGVTPDTTSGDPYAVVTWLDSAYVSRLNCTVKKLVGIDSSSPSGITFSARYMVAAHDHLFCANIVDSADLAIPYRCQWSDIYFPESHTVSSSSEADVYDLDVAGGPITGLTVQRDAVNIYTGVSIWRATYEGLPTKYSFNPLFTQIGAIYHYSVVQVKEVDFFIGIDNVYMLDGMQIHPIGDAIWPHFESDRGSLDITSYVRGYKDEPNNEVFWTYLDGSSVQQSIVYNYREKKWSTRLGQDLNAFVRFDRSLTVYKSWDTLSEGTWDAISGVTWDTWGSSSTLPHSTLLGSTSGGIFEYNTVRGAQKDDTTSLDGTVETFDFDFGLKISVKHLSRIKVKVKKTGTPTFTVKLGIRTELNDSITWSDALTEEAITGEVSFFFLEKFIATTGTTHLGQGVLTRIKIEWQNDNSNYISELVELIVIYTTPEESVQS